MLRRRAFRTVLATGCVLASAGLWSAAAMADRAFELVTPVDSRADIETVGGFSSTSGDLVVFASGESLAGAEPNGPFPTWDSYTARRDPRAGWSVEWTTDATDEPGTFGSRTLFSTDDGLRQLFQTENSIAETDQVEHSNDAYLRLRAPDGSRTMTWLTPGDRETSSSRFVVAATPDLETVLIDTESPMVPEDTDAGNDVYLVRDDGATLVTPGTTGSARTEVSGRRAVPGTLAEDASYVYFITASALDATDVDTRLDLYRWNDDGSIRLISVNRRQLPLGTDFDVTFLAASADGDRACFTTRTRLLDGDEDNLDDLYCYRVSTDTLERVSSGLNDNTTRPVRGLAVSEDGSSVFFSTDIALHAADNDAGQSLYLHRGGAVSYLGPLDATDTNQARRIASAVPAQRALRVSHDGTEIVFASARAIDTDEDRDARIDVYRWSLDGGFELVSAGTPDRDATIGAAPTLSDTVFTDDAVPGRVVAADWQAIYFETADPLVAEDTDGGYVDVYEWSDGQVRLISPPGNARYDALYVDNSADGSSVFFVTAEPVLPQDVNATRDLYVAREGGGFPLVPPTPGCVSDACQGLLPVPPAPTPPGSRDFTGPGDLIEEPDPDPTVRLLAVSSKQRRALVRRGRTAVRVRVSKSGIVAVTATARLGRRSVTVGRDWRSARRAGTVQVPLRLSRQARRQLKQRGRLRLTISVAFSGADEPARRVVVLRG